MQRVQRVAQQRWQDELKFKLSDRSVGSKSWWTALKEQQGFAPDDHIPPLNKADGSVATRTWKFYQDADSNSSRKLFFFSLVHLPVILMLMIISKKHYGRNKKTETAAGVSEEAGTKRLIPLTSSS
ncbi:hypothetical protein GWK47_004493 [Chionoecetes opilio]|uniref:Uncharacterized protein n=1 Tax=Chionoecetes opilio TaxID=41210 RepID=A0A8J4YEX0_CHIOP|nr:hypothetical protein GWK47_004493 [Chionoecetes opilio]